jgi:outer membrane immunogenic protein
MGLNWLKRAAFMKSRFGWALASAMLLGGIGSAYAADMPVKAKAPPPVVAYNWTGFYVGGEVGGIWGQASSSFMLPPPATYTNNRSTGIGGGFVGFQYQWNRIVLGVEAHGLGIFEQDLGRSGCNPAASCGPGLLWGHRWGDGIWTAGGRAGLAAGMWMPYVAGGYAATRLKNTNFNADGTVSESFSQDRSGWYGGVGVDWAFNNNWIVGAEYRHYDFGSGRGVPLAVGTSVPNPGDTVDTSLKADTVTVRLSYKFWGVGPVVAKY